MTHGTTKFPGRQPLFWIVAAVGTVLDLLSKRIVFAALAASDERVGIIPRLLDFTRSRNKGSAFGFLSDAGWVLTLISIGAIAMIVWVACTKRGSRMLSWSGAAGGAAAPPGSTVLWGLALVLGGAAGNLWDRVAYGHVRDFIVLYVRSGNTEYRWPTFNVADVLLCVGVGLLLLDSFRGHRTSTRRAAAGRTA